MSFRHDPRERLDALDWIHLLLVFGPFVLVAIAALFALIEGRG